MAVTARSADTPSALIYVLIVVIIGVFAGLAQSKFQLNMSQPARSFVKQSRDSLEKKTQNITLFYTQVFLNRNKTRVVIPWQYDTPTPPILVLGFNPLDIKNRREYLISHPQINDLPWPQIKMDDKVLFQRIEKFQSISDFIDNLPNTGSFVVDPTLKDEYPQLKGAKTTEALFDLDGTDYVFTRYVPSTLIDGVYYYENIVDATSAQINERNEMEWYIKGPLTTADNTFLLGHISIDYQQ